MFVFVCTFLYIYTLTDHLSPDTSIFWTLQQHRKKDPLKAKTPNPKVQAFCWNLEASREQTGLSVRHRAWAWLIAPSPTRAKRRKGWSSKCRNSLDCPGGISASMQTRIDMAVQADGLLLAAGRGRVSAS